MELTFISENGAAIHGIEHLGLASNNNEVRAPIVFGKTVAHILDVYETTIPLSLRQHCKFIRDMPTRDQEAALGLNGHALRLAMAREHSMPFMFSGDDRQLADLDSRVEQAGLSCRKGGRVFNLTGQHNKADAQAYVRDACQKDEIWPTTICLGDSENDRNMLEAADIACVIPLPNKPAMSLSKPETALVIANEPAPLGWKTSLERALSIEKQLKLVKMER
mgnify:CR=1 FL=1